MLHKFCVPPEGAHNGFITDAGLKHGHALVAGRIKSLLHQRPGIPFVIDHKDDYGNPMSHRGFHVHSVECERCVAANRHHEPIWLGEFGTDAKWNSHAQATIRTCSESRSREITG